MKVSKSEREHAIKQLQEMLDDGDTVFTILRRVSPSGMSRRIDVYLIDENSPQWLSYWASRAIGWTLPEGKSGINVSGCGMDMGFHLVDVLGRTIGRKLRHEWI